MLLGRGGGYVRRREERRSGRREIETDQDNRTLTPTSTPTAETLRNNEDGADPRPLRRWRAPSYGRGISQEVEERERRVVDIRGFGVLGTRDS